MQQPTIAGLRHAISATRLDAYAQHSDQDEYDALARYLWNGALGCALHPALHAVEITFRNAIYAGSLKIVDNSKLEFAEIHCWLDATPTLLLGREREAVEKAKNQLRVRKPHDRYMTPDWLTAKLGFGFWTGLCNAPYEQGRTSGPRLWPGLERYAFPFIPKYMRSRPAIFHHMNTIREFRNRVAHHEPIWDHDLRKVENEIIDTISWMNKHMAIAARRTSRLSQVMAAGYQAWRPQALHILGKKD